MLMLAAGESGILPPPTDLHVNQTAAWVVLWLVAGSLAVTVTGAAIITRRDKNPLFLLLPALHGLAWLVVPFVPPMVFMAYVVACTMPRFYAIHGQFGPIPFWTAAVISTVLNGGVAVAALYTDIAKSYRSAGSAASVRNSLIPSAVPAARA